MGGIPNLIRYAMGMAVFIACWELAGKLGLLGHAFPPISVIVSELLDEDKRGLFVRSTSATMRASLVAFILGTAAALALTVMATIFPRTERGLDTLASTLYAVPTIAFGPVLILLAGTANTAIILGALSTYFPIYVAVTSALRFAPPIYGDLAGALGSTDAKAFYHLRLPYSIPALVDGLRLGAPAAVLGVILGEWFGAPRGLGVLIISSLQNVLIPQLWAAALISIACSFGTYLVLSGVYRWAVDKYAW
jgi:NitT/TauT family transport system permease protein